MLRPELPSKFWQKWQAMLLIGLGFIGFLGYDLYLTYLRDMNFVSQAVMSSDDVSRDIYGKALIYLVFSVLLSAALLLIQRNWRNRYQAALALAEKMTQDLKNQTLEADYANAQSSALRQALLDNSAVGIILATQDRKIDQVSHRMCQMFGYHPEDFLQKSTEIIHIDRAHFEDFRNNYNRLLEESIVGVEYPFRHADGHVFWCAVTGTVLDVDDHTKGVIWSFLDIDERRRLAIEVENQKRTLTDILNNIPAAVSYWDCQDLHNIFNVFSNKTYADWYETTSEALVGIHVRDLLGDVVYTANWHRMVQAAQGETLVYDRVQPSINGQPPRHAQIHYIPNVQDGVTQGLYVMMFDTTTIKQSELSMKSAKEVAENATKAKSEFLANMSHEIRTPMNAIIGLTKRALETHLDSRQRDYLTKVHNAALALLRLLNDILDHSKIEAGRMTLEAVPFNLQRVIRDIEDLFLIRIEEKKLGWRVDIGPEVPSNLVGDPLRLGQVLINLVANAIKFTDAGEISLSFHCQTLDAGATELMVCVQDSGIGLSEEQSALIFGSFTQADSSVTRKYGGTGLGLSIAKQIIELMEGHITVKSQVGQGSQFSFTVKLGLACVQEDNALSACSMPSSDYQNQISVHGNPELSLDLPKPSLPDSEIRKLSADEARTVKLLLQQLHLRLSNNKFDARGIAEQIEKLLIGTAYAAAFHSVVTASRKLKFRHALTELASFPLLSDE